MYEWHPTEKREQKNIDERLYNYFGPARSEQPLPASSWQHLRSHLGHRLATKRALWLGSRSVRARARTLPPYIQEAVYQIAHAAHISPPAIRCSFKSRSFVPSFTIGWLRRYTITLRLPTRAEQALARSELEVLIASSLARYSYMRQTSYVLLRLLLLVASLLLLALATATLFWWHTLPLPIMLTLSVIVCGLYATNLWGLSQQARSIVRSADERMVQWIGRDRACQGLHALAARSHKPSHRRWNDLSLEERIQHVCGTHVELKQERYTLVH